MVMPKATAAFSMAMTDSVRQRSPTVLISVQGLSDPCPAVFTLTLEKTPRLFNLCVRSAMTSKASAMGNDGLVGETPCR